MTTKIEKLVLTGERRENLALAIAKATNPCVLSLLMLLAIIITRSDNPSAVTGWSLTVLFFLIALPLIYVYTKTSLNKNIGSFPRDPTTYLKQHPKDILILGIFCGLSSWLILLFLEAPSPLLQTLAALLLSALIVAIINLSYRVSFHMTATAILVFMVVTIWGPVFLASAVIIPVIGWAKYKLHEHTLAQMIVAIPLAAATVVGALYLPV